jgi:hypothetical protein
MEEWFLPFLHGLPGFRWLSLSKPEDPARLGKMAEKPEVQRAELSVQPVKAPQIIKN